MNAHDERILHQRLRTELSSLEISPVPMDAVTRRGRAARARRRGLAGGMAAAVAIAAFAVHLTQAPPAPGHTVTMDSPSPSALGGVFASGTADGKPWRLAVRNIATHTGGPWCLPAVMLNGRDGDVLFKTSGTAPSFGHPAFLYNIPGMPGIGVVFTQVAPQATRLVATWPDGRHVSARAQWVSACTQRFHLAGFAFADPRHGPSELATYDARFGLGDGLVLSPADAITGATGPPAAGVWVNLDKSRVDIAASQAASPIGTGTVAGLTWHMRTALGLFGQCYSAAVRGQHGRGQSSECVPVAASPRTMALDHVPVASARSQFTGYAGLVTPRTARLSPLFSDGTTVTVTPAVIAGRAYVAFVVPPGCHVVLLRLADATGHVFLSTTAVPPAR